MGGILHTIRTTTISKLYPQLRLSAANVKLFVDGVYMINATNLLEDKFKPNNLTQIRFGSGGTWVKESYTFVEGWDGQISELRLSSNIRYNTNFTAPTNAFTRDANTIALFKASTSTTWNEIVNDISVTPSGVFSLNSVETKNGLSYSLDIRNQGNISPGLVINGIDTWKDWPVTIEYWARAISDTPLMAPVIFSNQSNVDPRGVYFAVSPSRTSSNYLFLQSALYAAQTNNPLYVFANVWHHYAITISP